MQIIQGNIHLVNMINSFLLLIVLQDFDLILGYRFLSVHCCDTIYSGSRCGNRQVFPLEGRIFAFVSPIFVFGDGRILF